MSTRRLLPRRSFTTLVTVGLRARRAAAWRWDGSAQSGAQVNIIGSISLRPSVAGDSKTVSRRHPRLTHARKRSYSRRAQRAQAARTDRRRTHVDQEFAGGAFHRSDGGGYASLLARGRAG